MKISLRILKKPNALPKIGGTLQFEKPQVLSGS